MGVTKKDLEKYSNIIHSFCRKYCNNIVLDVYAYWPTRSIRIKLQPRPHTIIASLHGGFLLAENEKIIKHPAYLKNFILGNIKNGYREVIDEIKYILKEKLGE